MKVSKDTNEFQTMEIVLDTHLRKINQMMQDELHIHTRYRVNFILGLVIAGISVIDDNGNFLLSPLLPDDLKGDTTHHDGIIVMEHIKSFLDYKKVPIQQGNIIVNTLSNVFIEQSSLYVSINGDSKIKQAYLFVYEHILPLFRCDYCYDFTGKLFNVLNEWVNVPDEDKNDVVLTPPYVVDLMVKLAKVNKDSYVWDYCTGTASFLITSMHYMLEDAKNNITDKECLRQKENDIRCKQLLGIEKLENIYVLGLLNMLMISNNSSSILNEDSLSYNGKYKPDGNIDLDYPANVFLLNPPYSADGKGFIFVEKALSRMKNGRAVILIQENAGSGQGLPYTKNILKHSSLIASIHMADIFNGKAGVQTSIYVFNVGKEHKKHDIVKFIDFSNDGYARQNRKKSNQEINLKNIDHAIERYQEVFDVIEYGESKLHYLNNTTYIEDTITLNGDDWTFAQHKKTRSQPTIEDFQDTILNYLLWKISTNKRK